MNHCKLCGSQNVEVIHNGTRDRADIDVLKCKNCGLVFLSKIVTDENFYSDSLMRKTIDFDKWRMNTQKDDNRRYLQHKELIAGKNILDFGCGNGGFLKLAQADAKIAYGIDLDSETVAYLKNEGIKCFKSVEELPSIKFDVIFMFHVIEHLPDPKFYLDILSNYLCDGGIIIIETPNADDALLSLYRCKAFADFTYWSPHICLYNEFTLNKMLSDSGFEVLNLFQFQRYPISNHFKWLVAEPIGGGGATERHFMKFNNPELNNAYVKVLKELKICDTLICHIGRG